MQIQLLHFLEALHVDILKPKKSKKSIGQFFKNLKFEKFFVKEIKGENIENLTKIKGSRNIRSQNQDLRFLY